MDENEEMGTGQLEALNAVFRAQLTALLEECARGRRGLFGSGTNFEEEAAWPEAERLRELAMALQSIAAQADERCALCDEFLDLCTMHGESHPGEARLARVFLARIENDEVGTPTEPERTPW